MKSIFSVSMLGAALLFSLLYYVVVERTGAAVTEVEITFTEATDAKYVIIHTISPDSLVFTATPQYSPVIFHCLITGNTFDKLTGYGMGLTDFLTMTGEEAQEDRVFLLKTNGFTVRNYLIIPSEKLTAGKVYYLIAGEKDAEGVFTNNHTECIKIVL